jgi:hypothetical protein
MLLSFTVEELNRHGELDDLEGSQYVSALLDGCQINPSIERYVDIVRKTSGIRQIVRASELDGLFGHERRSAFACVVSPSRGGP